LAEHGGDLPCSEAALQEKAHLAIALLEVLWPRRTEPLQPHLLEPFPPARLVVRQAGIDQGLVDAAFAQPRPDLLWPLAALQA
jgi:hypothetical protein